MCKVYLSVLGTHPQAMKERELVLLEHLKLALKLSQILPLPPVGRLHSSGTASLALPTIARCIWAGRLSRGKGCFKPRQAGPVPIAWGGFYAVIRLGVCINKGQARVFKVLG